MGQLDSEYRYSHGAAVMAGGFGGIAAGLANTYPGYLAGQEASTQNDLQQVKLREARTEISGREAFGRTLALFGAAPGAVSAGMPAMSGPQPPTPGQPSVAAGGPPPQGGAPMEGGGSIFPYSPGGSPPQIMAQGGPPQGAPQPGGSPVMRPPMPGGSQGAPPQGAPQGGMQPSQVMDWRQIAAMVSKANPGAPPEVIAAAVSQFLPLMTQQAQQEWKLLQMQLQQERLYQGEERINQRSSQLDESERSHRATEDLRDRTENRRDQALQQAQERFKQTNALAMQRYQQAQEKLQLATSENDRKQAAQEVEREIRARDRYMRSEINIRSNLQGKEKADALAQLDREIQADLAQLEDFKKQGGGRQPASSPAPTKSAPVVTPPTKTPPTGPRMDEAPTDAPSSALSPADIKARYDKAIEAGFTREAILKRMKAAGLDTTGL